jgi:hypothetical protein
MISTLLMLVNSSTNSRQAVVVLRQFLLVLTYGLAEEQVDDEVPFGKLVGLNVDVEVA